MDARHHLHDTIDDVFGGSPQGSLAAISWLQRVQLPWMERHAVRRGRAAGFNWAEIGRLLGRSRQAVRSRYGDDVTRQGPMLPSRPRDMGALDERRYGELLADARRRTVADAPEDVVPW